MKKEIIEKGRLDRRFPAEWELQDAVLMTWPDETTDWADMLSEVQDCYKSIIREIVLRQRLILIGRSVSEVVGTFPREWRERITPLDCPINDTWARDYAPLTVEVGNNREIVDFGFNAWGLKFASCYDNQVGRFLLQSSLFRNEIFRGHYQSFIFEGGSIESNGCGYGLSTASCLWEANRNPSWTESEVTDFLKKTLGLNELIVLQHGAIPGDDTDGHVDTLARFISSSVVAYVSPSDPSSQAYPHLLAMQQELKTFTEQYHWQLIALPDVGNFLGREGSLIPATYANFLFVNGALLLPIYRRETDSEAIEILRKALPEREIVPIDCRALIEQHGSLHCVTMQYPKNTLL